MNHCKGHFWFFQFWSAFTDPDRMSPKCQCHMYLYMQYLEEYVMHLLFIMYCVYVCIHICNLYYLGMYCKLYLGSVYTHLLLICHVGMTFILCFWCLKRLVNWKLIFMKALTLPSWLKWISESFFWTSSFTCTIQTDPFTTTVFIIIQFNILKLNYIIIILNNI